MNKARRKQIQDIYDKLEEFRDEIEQVKNDEEEAYENMPDSLKYGERGESMESAIDILDSAYGDVDSAIMGLEEIING